ncbi:MAG: Set3 complex subunit with deacetylase activity, meiotic-specific repressor of sporulation proteins [Trizodia sp. TS-e1964]|nr:MAG: Set3 complex subunit with deacetylase activity, meiotic-specific repressor of sporulation proteins [Trizodia sp. TS-e1964]
MDSFPNAESSTSLSAVSEDHRFTGGKNPNKPFPPPEIRSSPPQLLQDAENWHSSNVKGNDEADAKSDSEAETIVLPGKEEDAMDHKGKLIKHEDDHHDQIIAPLGLELHMAGDGRAMGEDVKADARVSFGPSLGKRKRSAQVLKDGPNDGGNSSGLSSVPSSPMAITHSPRKVDLGSVKSPTSHRRLSLKDSAFILNGAQVTPNSRSVGETEVRGFKNHQSYEVSGASKDPRGSRSLTARLPSPPITDTLLRRSSRSISPNARNPRKAASTLSLQHSIIQGASGHKRRKLLPPPLSTRRRERSVDGNSDSSSNSESQYHHARAQKSTTGESNAMSPAKMPHKKHRGPDGRTPLSRACSAGEVQQARIRLAEWPQDLNIADNAGNTPLQISCLGGVVEIVKMLIDAGCDVNCVNHEKDTPLIDAVEKGHFDVVKLLLDAGANPRQGNRKGEEPLELLEQCVESDDESYKPIKVALLSAKEKTKLDARRPSEDHTASNNAGSKDANHSSRGASAVSPRNSPTFDPRRSPTLYPKRRTVRSEATRNDLLWTRATPENLKKVAGEGDMEAVGTILNQLPRADTESLIAAARGGHDEVIQLLLGLGGADADPEPLRTPEHKPGYNTPMLVAIGRGNEKVIELLLNQPNFDPIRRDHRGHLYHEIAQERRGFNWEKEVSILKEAYNKHMRARNAKIIDPSRASGTSDLHRKQRETNRKSTRSLQTDPSLHSLPSQTIIDDKTISTTPNHKVGSARDALDNENQPKSHSSIKRPSLSTEFTSANNIIQHTPSRSNNAKDRLTALPTKNMSPSAPRKEKFSSVQKLQAEHLPALSERPAGKPRRRLVSGKTMNSSRESERRNSLISSASSSPGKDKIASDVAMKKIIQKPPQLNRTNVSEDKRLATAVKRPSLPKEKTTSGKQEYDGNKTIPKLKSPKIEAPKERFKSLRANSPNGVAQGNLSSPANPSKDPEHHRKNPVDGVIKRRMRISSGSNEASAKKGNNDEIPNDFSTDQNNVLRKSQVSTVECTPEKTSKNGRFDSGRDFKHPLITRKQSLDTGLVRGHQNGAEQLRMQKANQSSSNNIPIKYQEIPNNEITAAKAHDLVRPRQERSLQENIEDNQKDKHVHLESANEQATLRATEVAKKAALVDPMKSKEFKENREHREANDTELARVLREAQQTKEAKEAKDTTAAIALEEAKEAKKEAQRREEEIMIEEIRIGELERQERIALEEEVLRSEKKRREEELSRRRAEIERIRREETRRKQAEEEARDALERKRLQDQKEREQREALPNGLRRLAEMTPDQARSPKELFMFLDPLHTVDFRQLDPNAGEDEAQEKWILNIQAAPILGLSDLELSQYTAWPKVPITPRHRVCMWRVLRMLLAGQLPSYQGWTSRDVQLLDVETEKKFFSMNQVFWIKLSDFMDIVPKYSHLQGLNIVARDMDISYADNGSGNPNLPPPLQNGVSMATNSTLHEQNSHTNDVPYAHQKVGVIDSLSFAET